MIRITDKSLCTGCTACMNICPAQCIVMRRDREGFDYPVANPDLCVKCGKCEKVCPVLNPAAPVKPLESLAARNAKYLRGSSSGGVFPAVAAEVIKAGGVVYGAIINEDMTIGHTDAEDMAGVQKMRGSKYVQSDLYGTYEEVRCHLDEGRRVLFTGTPCQIAGLKSYLGRDDDRLLTLDFACHGVPSPGLWEKYVKMLREKSRGDLVNVRFRDKLRSWMHYDFTCDFVIDGKQIEVRVPYMRNPYMNLFVNDMTLRPSCYRCPARNGKSGSDLTLADLWNVRKAVPEMSDDKGVSLVLVNTEKGAAAVSASDISVKPVAPEEAVRNNGGFTESIEMPQKRAEFFKGHHSAANLNKYMRKYMTRRPVRQIFKTLRSALSDFKRTVLK